MSTSAAIRLTPDGVREMTLVGPWTESTRDELVAHQVERLILNHALGFTESRLDFLEGLAIRELQVLDRSITDVSPLLALAPTLESLTIEVGAAAGLDVSGLPGLRQLATSWSMVRDSFDDAPAIDDLFIEGYTGSDLREFARLPLRRLVLKERPKLSTLDGLEAQPTLEVLKVFRAGRMRDIASLDAATTLRVLELERCSSIEDIGPVSRLENLVTVNLSEMGQIQSLEPLRACRSLRTAYLYGTTNIQDGDLGPLLDLPSLRELRMQQRRHYSPSVGVVQHAIASRHSG